MDKNNKYYNLIREQVENHKKYPGNEYILDEIIDDVYSHSEVIMNSITNEKVIIAYLQKVITTSIITVSKEMKRGNAAIPVPQVEPVLPQAPLLEEIKTEPVNNDLVEKMINNSYSEAPEPVVEEEVPAEENEEDFNYDTLDELDLMSEEPQEEPKEILEEEDFTDLPEESEDIQDTTLNEEPETFEEIQEEPSNEEFEKFEEIPSELEPEQSFEPLDEIQEVETEESFNLELENVEQEESFETLDEIQEVKQENSLESFEEVADVEPVDDFAMFDEVQNTEIEEIPEVEELDSGMVETDFVEEEVFEEIAPESFELEEADNNLIDLDSSDNLLSEKFTEDENFLQTGDTEDLEETVQEEPLTEGKQPDFSVFGFTPDNSDDEISDSILNSEDVQSSLETLDIRNPELKIKQVYKLKYEKGNTVSEIAKELDISEDDVIAGLTELVGLI